MIERPKYSLIKMSIPLIISLLISNLYNIIDSIWLSGLGADALAGIGYVTPLFLILSAIGTGLGTGSTSTISKYIGQNNKTKADNASIHTIYISIIISILTTIILIIFLKPILILLGAGNTIKYALDYGYIVFGASIIFILPNSIYGILRAEGDVNSTMYAMIISAIINMIIDPLFIYGLNLGVSGAAIATLISSLIVNILIYYWFYIKKNTYLKPFRSNFNYDKEISKDILKVGLPVSIELINNSVFALVFSALLTIIGSTDSVAVYSIGWKIVTISTTPIIAISTALLSLIAINYGSKNYKNIKVIHGYSMKISLIFSIIIGLLIYLFAPQIVNIFTYSGSSSVRLADDIISFLSIIILFFPTMALGAPSTYVFQALGHGITAMIQTILRESLCTLIIAVVLSLYFNMGIIGAWLSIIFGELIMNIITLIWANYYVDKLIENNIN